MRFATLSALRPHRAGRRELARRIAARRAEFESCGVFFPKAAVAAALRTLRPGGAHRDG